MGLWMHVGSQRAGMAEGGAGGCATNLAEAIPEVCVVCWHDTLP